MRSTFLGAATLTAAAILTLAQLAPAHADGIGVKDPKDLAHGVDLRSVQVEHKARSIVVTTTHTDLRPSFRTGASGSVFLDTDPSDPGPEYVFAGGYFMGTDYQLLAIEGFAGTREGTPVDGSYVMRIDYDRDHVRMRIAREALGSPDEVRVAVKVAGSRPDGGNTRRDWLGEPRSFTEWVAQ
ncbi:hypothetical protein GCM10011376_27410 [Nocardioides flavus (ex Wang et al. 2016)]|uniref:Uncharacterized protein n=1 Tax=Nocardioides flavus (ex Wang et al. 2016) TaxID=2058780 RepID=A0ABQ3HKQ2_9ACTN|nr:hypothetical protein [Nocardioides flavus (ex Wang et al. 2016)]GHE18131.1 hypothetical protein GCM10011376_27410 [Nocardioides flavus (ex Wang et al. 2016)]